MTAPESPPTTRPNDLGYSCSRDSCSREDGRDAERFDEAIREFQREHDLEATGVGRPEPRTTGAEPMSDGDSSDLQHTASEGAVAADHPPLAPQPVLVAPATAGQFNTIGERLLPKACFRFEDVRFDFDSSFVRPELKKDLVRLADLIERHTIALSGSPPQTFPPPLSIFGHADPSGDDDYNKHLSGRRALAIYGMLVRDEDIWEHLFTQPFGGDQWGERQVQTMLEALGYAPGQIDGESGQTTSASAKAFQADNGLSADGIVGPQTRKKLFRAYMDFLCGPRLELDEEKNFLARHKDGKGLKGDVQGCSEFNPLRMFSHEEHEKFEQDSDKHERNRENAPNRRVIVLLYPPGRRVNPKSWPCPRAKEGVDRCKKRFFPDSSKRRSFQSQRREFARTRDTFACRFYQLISDDSPCERFMEQLKVRLYDPSGRFVPNAPCRVTIGNQPPYLDKANGEAVIVLRDILTPKSCLIEWGLEPKEGEEPALVFQLDMLIVAQEKDEEEELNKKLNNLGYIDDAPSVNVEGFQRDYGHLADPPLPVNGEMDERTKKLLRDVYSRCAEDIRNTKVD